VHEWSLRDVPDVVAGDLRQTAAGSYQVLIQLGRDVVLRQLQKACPADKETAACWREVQDWLRGTSELRDWQRLTGILARLSGESSTDPVADLVSFLGKDRFELEMRTLSLTIPDDLNVRPVGKLSIFHQAKGEAQPTLTYRLLGEGRREARRRATIYTLVPEDGTTLIYRPGDTLWAEMSLNGEAQLSWSGCRSLVYQYERLLRVPRLLRPGSDPAAAPLAKGVNLAVTPERGIPPVPDLLPVVKLENR
jgi:hypothetical protein